MFDWMKRKVPFFGSVLYRGRDPMRAEEFGFLADKGIHVSPHETAEGCHWSIELEHPEWGAAILSCPRAENEVPLRYVFDVGTTLTPKETETARTYGTQMVLNTEGKKEDLLRDRKNALRFLRAVMDDDGLAVVDYLSMGVWSREALEEELAHDADMDIGQIFAMHVVGDDKGDKAIWAHTHGLGEIGFFDFDIVSPSDDMHLNADDLFRSIAFAIVEKQVSVSTSRHKVFSPGGAVRFVDVKEFNGAAESRYLAMRTSVEDDGHNSRRAVLCEPTGGGLLTLFSKRRIRPARVFMGSMPDNMLMSFSTPASNLMAQRAQQTYGRFKAIAEEFEDLDFAVLVKLGYVTDGGGEDDKEHLWFTVNQFFDDEIDGTLENEPYHIARMKVGDRGRHPVPLISDWMILTPAGAINPRSSRVARALRENSELLDEMREVMEEHRRGEMNDVTGE